MNPVSLLHILLWVYTAVFFLILIKDLFTHRKTLKKCKTSQNIFTGMCAYFFDPLGIGSFPTAAVIGKFTGSIPDALIPGTLTVAFAVPASVEASIFIRKIEMDIPTLVLMICASVIGASISARILAMLNITKVRIVTGAVLLLTSAATLCRLNAAGPFGIIKTTNGLEGGALAAAVLGSLLLGALIPAGAGGYSPCMALVLLLGMTADTAFPVIISSCAFLIPSAGITFIKKGSYQRESVLPMAIGGTAGVTAAGFLKTTLPLTLAAYLICFMMAACACIFFHDAWKSRCIRPKTSEKRDGHCQD